MTDEILFERAGGFGVVTLNRPDALNALTLNMVTRFRAQLLAWRQDADVKAVLVAGAGEKAFCAGGDIRWLYDHARKDPERASGFFREEYRLNALIHHYPKPYVALVDGVVMGGGVGVSVHGDFRIAGERTLFAMPETAIGLFPDVGGGYVLPRLPDGLGLYYALSGARARAADCVAAGIATHYVPGAALPALKSDLLSLRLGARPQEAIGEFLDARRDDPGAAPIDLLRREIARLFSGRDSLEDLFAALAADGGAFAEDLLKTLARMSPTSMKLTFEQLKRGRALDFDDDMRMEFRMVRRVMEGHDFFEGVRSLIVDKDKNPHWRPARIDEVSDADIARHFAPLDNELELP